MEGGGLQQEACWAAATEGASECLGCWAAAPTICVRLNTTSKSTLSRTGTSRGRPHQAFVHAHGYCTQHAEAVHQVEEAQAGCEGRTAHGGPG